MKICCSYADFKLKQKPQHQKLKTRLKSVIEAQIADPTNPNRKRSKDRSSLDENRRWKRRHFRNLATSDCSLATSDQPWDLSLQPRDLRPASWHLILHFFSLIFVSH